MPERARILFVDDNPYRRRLVAKLIENSGYDVVWAATGVDALRLAAEQRPDLILLDVVLPGMDGFEVCRRLKAKGAPVVVILFSAVEITPVSRARSLEVGADDYLFWPLPNHELVARVQTWVRIQRAEEALWISHRFLQLANQHSAMKPLLAAVVAEVRAFTGCAAVGIRLLDQDGGIPYEAFEGFSSTFYESESPLSISSDECMCINVIKAEVDATLPFYTEGGSFYMNGTSRFLTTISEEEKGRTRNVCNLHGYESVALIPIQLEDRNLGLIHIADVREGQVPPRIVKILEGVAMQLGTAIQRVRLEEESRQRVEKTLGQNEAKYRTLFESMAQGVFYQRADGALIDVNPAALEMFGLEREQFLGTTSYNPQWDVIREDGSLLMPELHPSMVALESGEPVRGVVLGVYNPRREDYVWLNVNAIPLFRPGESRPYQVFVTLHDITERRRAEEELRTSQRFIEKIAETMPDILYIYDAVEERNVYANRELVTTLGYSMEEMQKPGAIVNIIHPDDLDKIFEKRRRMEEIQDGEVVRSEYRMKHANGDWRWILSREVVFTWNADGCVRQMLGIAQDITEHKQAEESSLEYTRQLETLRQMSLELATQLEQKSLAQSIVAQAVRLLWAWAGSFYVYQPQQQMLERLASEGPVPVPKAVTLRRGEGVAGKVLETKQPLVMPSYEAWAGQVTMAAEPFPGAVVAVPVLWGDEFLGVLELLADVPDAFSAQDVELLTLFAAQAGAAMANTRLFEQVDAAKEHTRFLARQVVSAQEEERRRLSRELHDEAGQALTALKLSLQLLQEDLSLPGEELHRRLAAAVGLADATMEQIRLLAHDLRPPTLDAVGLNTALEGFCHDFAARTHVSISYRGEELPEPPDAVCVSLYRFLQEGLTNVVRHSGADHVWVSLMGGAGTVALKLEDNGCGFDVQATLAANGDKAGMGLAGMRERLEVLGGSLNILSLPGCGTQMVAQIPWQEVK